MLISKASLGVVAVAAVDKAIPALGNICVCADGSTVGANSAVIVCVGPIEERIRDAAPLDKGEDGFFPGEQIILSAEASRSLMKAMPRDTLFKGLLEMVSLKKSGDDGKVIAQTTDGKRKTETKLSRAASRWIEWKKIIRTILRSRTVATVRVNRRRLENVIEALKGACPYSGEFSSVQLEFKEDGHMSLRAINELTGQRVVIGFAGSSALTWPEETAWEKGLSAGGAVRKKI